MRNILVGPGPDDLSSPESEPKRSVIAVTAVGACVQRVVEVVVVVLVHYHPV